MAQPIRLTTFSQGVEGEAGQPVDWPHLPWHEPGRHRARNSSSSSRILSRSGAIAAAMSSVAKRGVICWEQFQSNASTEMSVNAGEILQRFSGAKVQH